MRDQRLRELETRRELRTAELRIVGTAPRRHLSRAPEHFGFMDGFSQPVVVGSGPGRGAPRGAAYSGALALAALRLGEFVLGHLDEDGVVPGRAPLLRNGTFMVWRKLSQDVALFRRWMAELAGTTPTSSSGSPPRSSDAGATGVASISARPDSPRRPGVNTLHLLKRSSTGFVCPLGAHVRRANPRDSLGWRTERTKRHRIIRRGMPYGPRLAEGAS